MKLHAGQYVRVKPEAIKSFGCDIYTNAFLRWILLNYTFVVDDPHSYCGRASVHAAAAPSYRFWFTPDELTTDGLPKMVLKTCF